MKRLAIVAVAFFALQGLAQEEAAQDAAQSPWDLRHRLEIRANWRDSHQERFQLRFPFPPEFLPVGQTAGFMETVDAGTHVELSVVQLQLDANYGTFFGARARIHFLDKYRRNPTSTDRKVDADELFLRLGRKPEFLELPEKTSFFLQVGKAPKIERQPTRLLESYGITATSFNRFEDVQAIVGGTVGRNLYWRVLAANGNPLFFRDMNALAGDNGIPELLQPNPNPDLKSGFPTLYNAEVEGYFFETDNIQYGQGLGYRWQRVDQTLGFDVLLFHYQRDLADEADLSGTFYGGDLDLLDGTRGISLPISGRKKEEYGGRLFSEWHGLTVHANFTKQHLAGLQRQGYEFETGYRFDTPFGPLVKGESLVRSIQPAARISGITNRFRGDRTFVAPSVWWPWTKIDYGLRIGFARNTDLTIEYAKHNVGAPRKIDVDEMLVTLRVRV